MWSATKTIKSVGIGILAVLLDRGDFLFVRAAAEQILHAAHEEHLKRRHQRRRAGAVQNFGEIGFGEIEIEQAEVAQVGGDQMLEDRVAEALAEESFIADEHVGRAQLARLQLADEALGLGEGAHQDGLSVEVAAGHCGTLVCDSVFDCNIGESIRLGVAGCGNGYGVYLYARDPSLRLKNGSARDDAGERASLQLVHDCSCSQLQLV